MPYAPDEIIEPFYGERQAESNGRDPLAIQNSSVVVYTKMVPGITNVTYHLRYNGFYCWVLDTIVKNIEQTNSRIEQIRYVRRAELLLAYIMVNNFPEVTGVSGSAYPNTHNDEVVNLIKGADIDTKILDSPRLYWQLSTGAFGQYYIGVLKDLGLLNHPNQTLNIFTLTKEGARMADVFSKSIPATQRNLFWKFTLEGILNKKELVRLKSFSLINIPPISDENIYYKELLLGKDSRGIVPTYHRNNTIRILLEYIALNKNGVEALPYSFLSYNYEQKKSVIELSLDTGTGWYLYEINELLHVAFEHFHGCFISILEYYPTPVNDIIDYLLNEATQAFKHEKIIPQKTTLGQLLEIVKSKKSGVYNYYGLMEHGMKESEWGNCIVYAVKTVLQVYIDCEKQMEMLKIYSWSKENNFNRQGYAIELLEEMVQVKKNILLTDYLKDLILFIINQHTFSSYRKSRIGQGLVHNYLIEDNMVCLLRSTFPSRTSSRLQNVTKYLLDIGWLEKNEKKTKITGTGKTILTALCNQK